MPRSLLWSTGLDVLPFDRVVEQRAGYLLVRSPSHPEHYCDPRHLAAQSRRFSQALLEDRRAPFRAGRGAWYVAPLTRVSSSSRRGISWVWRAPAGRRGARA